MKKVRGRLCFVLLGLLAAINAPHAAQIDVVSNGLIGSDDYKLLQQQIQALTTQAKLSDVLIKQLLEKMYKMADEVTTLKQQRTAVPNTDDAIDLEDCNSKVSLMEEKVDQLNLQENTLNEEISKIREKIFQKTDVYDLWLIGGKIADRQLAVACQETFWEFKISVNCTLAGLHSPKLKQLANGKKYFFSNQTANWTEADEKCKGMGFHLATIRDEADLDATLDEAIKRKNGTFWRLSAKKYGRWVFLYHDGSIVKRDDIDILYWVKADELDCLCLSVGLSTKMAGCKCSSDAHFICEIPSECS
ncbi:uncharacterized protein LOC132197293 isoform X2 [Neocloeon triangulifer]|uniref:uncharacterized protein LOC132197293 isoform X2 n=1 Tax=Neocloeon triangulifer TaxID=2078957 RepID=UPI00286F2D36|nr:uncharacterized protein LOC132197293 isoform X2 [Neocloeon triangulifer]